MLSPPISSMPKKTFSWTLKGRYGQLINSVIFTYEFLSIITAQNTNFSVMHCGYIKLSDLILLLHGFNISQEKLAYVQDHHV